MLGSAAGSEAAGSEVVRLWSRAEEKTVSDDAPSGFMGNSPANGFVLCFPCDI